MLSSTRCHVPNIDEPYVGSQVLRAVVVFDIAAVVAASDAAIAAYGIVVVVNK